MVVVSLSHRDTVGVMKSSVDFSYFPNGFVRALDWEKVEHGNRHENRTRVHHEQEARVVYVI